MKKLIALLLTMVMAVSLVACAAPAAEEAPAVEAAPAEEAAAPAEEDELFIGWIACDFSAPSVARSREGAEAKAAELGIKIVTLDSAGDVQKEADNALNLLSQQVDGIIIEPNDMAAFVPIAQQIKDAGIPLIVFCQEFEEQYQDLRICYVGCKDYDCGVFAGEEAIRCLGEEGGNVVIVNGQVGSTPQIQRGKGFRDALEGHDNIVILEEQCSPWDRAKAVEIMEDFITRYGEDIDLVYAMDDNLAIGAVEALRSAGLSGKIPVIGYNGMSDAFELIKSGEMYSTLIQPLYWGGGVAVQAMYDYLTGKEIEPAYYDTMVNVTAENVDELQPEW